MAYSIGIDFGTESGRVLLLDLETGEEKAAASVSYKHGVISKQLPETEAPLPPDFALQDPRDYIEVINAGIPQVLGQSGVNSQDVIGIGIDFTSCTVLPVLSDGTPLCTLPEWSSHPHAWPKLWKHHAAQSYADRINDVAKKRNEDFITRYGGQISSEWYFPKLLEIFENDLPVYHATYAFVEAADWIVWYLTGNLKRNSCTAGFKALWSEGEGLPPDDFFREVNPNFIFPSEKLGVDFYPLGTRAGFLRETIANTVGLTNKVAVAVGNIDAHVSVPSVGVQSPGSMVLVMGTSTCHLTMTQNEVRLPGITGVVKGGILPELYGYEAGQAAVGDMFSWFVQNGVPEEYHNHAKSEGISLYEYLENVATRLEPGETGLIAMDWWNGNRSIIGDANLSGMIFGLNLSTKPEEIYRTLLESTAFGTRVIVENFINNGVEINELVICGGIAVKSPLLMQLYADICKLPITVKDSTEIPARGAAMFGAVAAGSAAGGFASIQEASMRLNLPVLRKYAPNSGDESIYENLYRIYIKIYQYFGVDELSILHNLKNIRLTIK